MNIHTLQRLAFASALLLAGHSAYADIVTGTVVDNEGEPVIGGSVRLKNGKAAVATDLDGNFSLDVPNPKKGH